MQPKPLEGDRVAEVLAFCEAYVDPESFSRKRRQHGDMIVAEEDFQESYSDKPGRPPIAWSLKIKLLLLQRYDNVSDREAERRSRLDLAWKLARKVPWDWPGMDHATLVVTRTQLILNEKYRKPFDRSVKKAIELGLLPPEAAQVTDSSAMRGAAQVQDTYELLRTSLQKMVRKVRARDPKASARLVEKGLDHYEQEQGKAKINWDDERERVEPLRNLVGDGEAVARIVRESEEKDPELEEGAKLFERIVEQDTEEGPGGVGSRRG